MIGRNNVISTRDFDRLNAVIHSSEIRSSYGQLTSMLKRELGEAGVVEADSVPGNVVTMNSRVRIRDQKTGTREAYTLAYPQEANINEERLSVLAPLGMALLGAREGDVVDVKAPGGVRRIRVERILYQPEAAGDLHL